jgi:hypothetical protein
MTQSIRYTLLSDGTSDRTLMPIVSWALAQRLPQTAVNGGQADLSHLHSRPQGLVDRIRAALEYFPCDILFIHRDAEKQPWSARVSEIQEAIDKLAGISFPSFICVIPVRTMEAWLLLVEGAIRSASGNPKGRCTL